MQGKQRAWSGSGPIPASAGLGDLGSLDGLGGLDGRNGMNGLGGLSGSWEAVPSAALGKAPHLGDLFS